MGRFTLKLGNFAPILVAFLVIYSTNSGSTVDGQRIGGDLHSTLRIVARLCFNPRYHTSNIVNQFYGCYDYAPGKPQFVTCQQRSFGNVLNSIPRIDASCRNPRNPIILAGYQRCLQQEFQRAGISMQNAVTQVNVCQGRVLGF